MVSDSNCFCNSVYFAWCGGKFKNILRLEVSFCTCTQLLLLWDVFLRVVIKRNFQVNTPDVSLEGLSIHKLGCALVTVLPSSPVHRSHVLSVAAPLMELFVARLALEELVQVDNIDVVVQLSLVEPGLVTLRALKRSLFVMNNLNVLLEVAFASGLEGTPVTHVESTSINHICSPIQFHTVPFCSILTALEPTKLIAPLFLCSSRRIIKVPTTLKSQHP